MRFFRLFALGLALSPAPALAATVPTELFFSE